MRRHGPLIAHDQGWSRRALWVRAESEVSSSAPGSSTSSTRTTTPTVAVGRYRERFAALEQIGRAASRVLDRALDRVCQTREPVVVTGTENGIALGSKGAVAHGLRSILVAPLLLGGRRTTDGLRCPSRRGGSA